MMKLFLCSYMDFNLHLHQSQAITALKLRIVSTKVLGERKPNL